MKFLILSVVFFSLINPARPLAQTKEEFNYYIFVDFSALKLYLTTLDSQIIRSYPVALPYFKMNLPVEGKVVGIIKNPWWFPTEKTRKDYLRKHSKELPAAIPPGHHLNAMGAVKMVIDFPKERGLLRIHGTNEESLIGHRVSRGCVRMSNKDILELSELIRGEKTKAQFIDEFFPGPL